ncbi:hypothetical protein ACVBEF_04375 [Glaciimonas sp. GG7]
MPLFGYAANAYWHSAASIPDAVNIGDTIKVAVHIKHTGDFGLKDCEIYHTDLSGNNYVTLWKDGWQGWECRGSSAYFPINSNGDEQFILLNIADGLHFSPGKKFRLAGYVNPHSGGKDTVQKEIQVRSLSGDITSVKPDNEVRGRVTLTVTKGNGANGDVEILDKDGDSYSKTVLADGSIRLNNLIPGEHTVRLYVFYNNKHKTMAKEVKVRVLGGSFQAWVQNGRVRTKGNIQGGADELHIYRNGSHFKTVKNFTANDKFSEYDFILENLPGGISNLQAYAYKGTQWLSLSSTQVTLPPDKPAQPTWVSPGNNTEYQPSSGALKISGQTISGVDRVFFRSRVVSPNIGEWQEEGTGTAVLVNTSGAFSNASFYSSTSWETGKSYEVQFDVKRGASDRSPWSISRRFNVPHERPPRPTWISPGDGTSYQPSSTPLQISGKTIPGVTTVSVTASIDGKDNWSQTENHSVTVGSDGIFSNVPVNISKTWEAGKSYEVKFDVYANGKWSVFSVTRKFNVPRGALGKPTLISPLEAEWEASRDNPLIISVQTETDVNRIYLDIKVDGSWSGFEGIPVSVNDEGIVDDLVIEASKTWEQGKIYAIRFAAMRNNLTSPTSNEYQFYVPRPTPDTPTWITPADGSWQQPSASSALTFNGQTVIGVTKVAVRSRVVGGNWSADETYTKAADTNNRVTDVPIAASKMWLKGSNYEVQFRVLRDDLPSEWSATRLFKVPREKPPAPTWITPADGSWHKPSAAPITISGKTVPGVATVYVSSTVKGGTWSDPVSHAVTLDAEDIFKDVSIEPSKLWENGKIYSVRFTVERDGLKTLSAERDFKIDTTPPSIAWATGADPMVGHASPGKPFTVKVDVSDALSRVDPATVKLRWKTGNGNWSSDALMINGSGDRYTADIAIPAISKNREQLTLQVKATDNAGNVLGYADNHQHTVTVSKPVVILTKPVSNSWHNGQKINVSGTATAAADIVSVSIGQRQSGSGDYGSWHHLCTSRETCHATHNAYRFDDVEYNQPLLKKDIDIVVLAKDIHGVETYSTTNGQANGIGLPLRYDGKAPEITIASAQWQTDGSLTVSGTVSDDASGLGAQGDGKGAIVLRWKTGGDGQRTVDASGTGVGGAVNFSSTFAAGVFPTSSAMTFSVTASDRAGNISMATEATAISPIPKLTLSVKQLQTPRHAWFVNETLVYRLTLAVGADSACATNIHLSYALPPQLQKQANTPLTLVNSAPTVRATLDPTWGDPGRKNLLAAGGKLCAGQSLTIDIPLVIAANASGQNIENQINATADGLTGPIALTQTDRFTVMPEQGALRFEKKVDKDSAVPGEDLSYTIIFRNRSEQHLTMREITDNIAPYTRLQGMPECGVMPDGLRCSPLVMGTRALKWEFTGELPPGKSGQVTYKVQIQ